MATYNYQQNVFDGASYGYVKYNITPDFGTPVSPGTIVTITGQAYFKERANKSLQVLTRAPGVNKSSYININIPKATVTTFTISFPMWTLTSAWGTGRVLSAPIEFVLWSGANIEGNGDGTVAVSTQVINYLTYRISPSARSVAFERYSLTGGAYVKNDEGVAVMGSFAISLASDRTVSDITIAKAVVTGGDGTNRTITLSNSVLTAALSSAGYKETSPGLFAGINFNTGYDYTITFTIGDAYDTAVFSVLVARAFANLHLSGQPTGGVAFGKFSASSYGNPLFECAFPIVLSGSKTYGPESIMPSNPVEGQLFFVVE